MPSRRPFRPSTRRFRPGYVFERLEARALLTVSALDFDVNELENSPGVINVRPFVTDTAASPDLKFSVGTPDQGGKISNLSAVDGTFTYTPPSATFLGTEKFTYTATDQVTGETDTKTITVRVGKLAADRVGVPVLEGQPKPVNLGANVSDVLTNPSLTFTIPSTSDKGGSISNIDTSKGTFTYTPSSSTFTGTDTLTYTVKDNTDNASSSAVVTFRVASLIANADSASILEGSSKIVNLSSDIQDTTANPTLQFSIPSTSADGGAITGIDTSKGIFTYAPPSATFTGTDTVTYTVTDKATNTTATGVFTLNVASLIAQPVHVGDLQGKVNSIQIGPAIQDITANPTLQFSIPSTSTKGGAISNIDAARGSFSYTPPSATFTGVDTLTYTVTDTTTHASVSGTVTIDVETILAAPLNLNVTEGQTKAIILSPSVQDITLNPTLKFTIPATSERGGTISSVDTTNGTFVYTPPSATFVGGDTLTYTVTDTATNTTANGLVILNVAALAANPVVVSVLQNASKTVDLAPAVQDVTTNPTLKFTVPSTSQQGGTISSVDTTKGSFTYSPPSATFTGTDTLTYSVTDTATNASDNSTVTIHVQSIIAGQSAVGLLPGTTKNVALAPLVLDVTTNPTLQFTIPSTSNKGGTISNIDTTRGTFTYAPPSTTFTGTDTLTYSVTDTATKATDSGTITFNVSSLFAQLTHAGDLTGQKRVIDLGPAVQDTTAKPTLQFTIPATTDQGGTVSKVDTATGAFTYTPPSTTFTGTDTLTYTVTDTTTHATTTGMVTIHVASLFADPVHAEGPQNTPRTINLGPAVLDANATPILNFTLPSTSDQGGAITNINTSTGTFTYTPPSRAFSGTDTLTYMVTDTTTGVSDSAQVTVLIIKSAPPLTIVSTTPTNGTVASALPSITVVFSQPLDASTLYQLNGQTTGLLASNPYSIFLIAQGPARAFTAPNPSNYEGGSLPIPARTTYQVNSNGTSQITVTPTEPLSADIYAISVTGAYTDIDGNTLAAGTGQGIYYATFLYLPPPTNNNALQVTSVTADNGGVVINNNAIPQPDTISINFNKPLYVGAANGNTVQLFAIQGSNYVLQPSVAAYSPTTDSILLTPTGFLLPGTTYLIRVAGADSGSPYVSDNQGIGVAGAPLPKTFYDPFTVQNFPGGGGTGPFEVASTNGQPDTLPASYQLWTKPVGYASIQFTREVSLASLTRYSVMLVPQSGGLNPTLFDQSDVPLNATLALNPNTDQLIIVPILPVGNDVYLYALQGFDAALPNGAPDTSHPLLNLSGAPAGTGGPPFYTTFGLKTTTPAITLGSAITRPSTTIATAGSAGTAVTSVTQVEPATVRAAVVIRKRPVQGSTVTGSARKGSLGSA